MNEVVPTILYQEIKSKVEEPLVLPFNLAT